MRSTFGVGDEIIEYDYTTGGDRMIDYDKMATAELIDLLFENEDWVAEQQIMELISRGDEAAALLREFLTDEDFWYEGRDGDHWIPVHAIVILSALRDEKAFPDLIEMVPHAYFSNHHGVIQILPAALAEYGEKGIEPYTNRISELRGAYWDNPDFSSVRYVFSEALTRIALRNDLVRGRITDFICNTFADPGEDDSLFLSLSAAHPAALDKDRGMKALRMAYQRGAIDEAVTGKFKDLVKSLEDPHSDDYTELEKGLFNFYHPALIAERQREKAESVEERLYWGIEDKSVPSGYTVTAEGVIRGLEKVGRNDPCPCESGKKYKKCCGADR
jgi:SEC-C motif-containing protein